MLFRIIYFSKETEVLPDSGIRELLGQSRDRNRLLEITGMLLYIRGTFLQVLEGPEDGVKAVFKSIRADLRHHQVTSLVEEPVDSRDFPDWSMGFEAVDPESGVHAADASNFLRTCWDELDLESYPEKTRLFLKTFYEVTG